MKKLVLLLSWLIISGSVSAQSGTNLKELENLAKQGDLAAQIELANTYRKGIGVSQDYKTAVKWFILAEEQGDAVSQYNLGIMHSFGLGIVPDYQFAIKWYTLAAEQGNALAQYNLGRMYYLGKGVPDNLVYAHMWATQASSNGLNIAIDFLRFANRINEKKVN